MSHHSFPNNIITGKSRLGLHSSYNIKKMKAVLEKLPDKFTVEDVKDGLDVYYGLTSPPRSTINNYLWGMISLGYAEKLKTRISKANRYTYKKLKQ